MNITKYLDRQNRLFLTTDGSVAKLFTVSPKDALYPARCQIRGSIYYYGEDGRCWSKGTSSVAKAIPEHNIVEVLPDATWGINLTEADVGARVLTREYRVGNIVSMRGGVSFFIKHFDGVTREHSATGWESSFTCADRDIVAVFMRVETDTDILATEATRCVHGIRHLVGRLIKSFPEDMKHAKRRRGDLTKGLSIINKVFSECVPTRS
jgi:hypothetical protein